MRDTEKLPIVVRALVPGDRRQWDPLWQGYLTFYKVNLPPAVTEATWARFHDAAEPMHAFGAFEGARGTAAADARLVGIVHCVYHRSTWAPGLRCYLEDLFVSPQTRGRHVGRRLIEAVYAHADAAGADRVYWHTHETNYRGRMLYDQVATNAGFIHYRSQRGG